MSERIVHCLTLNSLTLNVGSLNVVTSRRLKEKPIGYFKFADPEVSRIVAENWGDGTGTTLEQIEAVTDIGTKFKGNTVIESFDELKKFIMVTELDHNAFSNCTKLRSIDLTNVRKMRHYGVYSNGTFDGCVELEELKGLDNLEEISPNAFSGCSSLVQDIYLPKLKTIYTKQGFSNSGITKFEALNVESELGYKNGAGLFEGCLNLKSIRIPNVQARQSFAKNCQSLDDVFLPNLTMCESSSFNNCTSLKSFPFDNVTEIWSYAFYGCSILSVKNTQLVTIIGASAFRNCEGINDINFPSLLSIDEFAFDGDINIKKIVDLGKITKLGLRCFGTGNKECIPLEYIEYPSTITDIGRYVYVNGSTTRTLNGPFICKAQTPPIATWDALPKGNFPIYVPDQSVEAYKTATNWVTYADRIKPLSETKSIILLAMDKYIGRRFNIKLLYGPLYEYEKGVTWSITSGSEYASIDQEGNVTINESANNSVITVRATSIYNDTIYDDIDITVTYASPEYLYILPEETVFNNSNYIDTGIQLMDEDIDYTIYVRGIVNAYSNLEAIFHCVRESSPYPGILMDCTDRSVLRIGYGRGKEVKVPYTYGNEFELKVTHASGTASMSYSFTTNGRTTSGEKTDYEFVKLSQTLLIGAYQTIDGSKGRFLNGTISEFYIRNYVEK